MSDILFPELEVDRGEVKGEEVRTGRRKLRAINRAQRRLVPLDVEALIPIDHKARAIWDLAGRLDLSAFERGLKTEEGSKGAPAWSPRLLLSVWVYALSEGIRTARSIARMMEYEPGLRWLAGLEQVNHHTLSDFLTGNGEGVRRLMADMLAMLEHAGQVDLERVMHDGTKVRAQAGAGSFRREKTIRERLKQARVLVAQLEGADGEAEDARREAARKRAAREQAERLERALEELKQAQAEEREKAPEEVRVSISDPDARVMRHGDCAIAPSYNVQISTDAKQTFIIGVEVSQSSSDFEQLKPAIETIEGQMGRVPQQLVVDGGYVSEENIEGMAAAGIELIGPESNGEEGRSKSALKRAGIDPAFGPKAFVVEADGSVRCPAGKLLKYERQSRKHGKQYRQYRADGADCGSCPLRALCCPRKPKEGRLVSIRVYPEAVMKFREKMKTEQARRIYRQRSQVAEFPNACIKQRIGLRKFMLRGLHKVRLEALWACLTFNVVQWIGKCWAPAVA
jgi:transposase